MAQGEATPETADQFALRMITTVSSGFVSLGIAVGARTGLIAQLAEADGPETAVQIAEKANMKERYVREWLAVMATARIVDYDKETGTYYLPKHRVGVPYSAYPDFHGWMASVRIHQHKNLVSKVVPTVPGLGEALEAGIRVLDAGCGRGIAITSLAQHFPKSTFNGTDLSEEVIQWASEEGKQRGLAHVTFQADPDMALREIFRMVKPGGQFSMVDIKGHSELEDNMGNPVASLLYGASLFHCMPVSLYFGGKGLGTVWGQELAGQMLLEAGFTNVRALDVPQSPVEIHFLCNKP
ncbi:uncharacterized protein LOC118405053 [Branchiostoma floridae]|uniref:Uncharacterized protein LOC118405053 n=1 Tax=Branchiostoma floridae TaxID=7739 RepID=A0A9J7HN74_BRAFL|nr:uncharacterized protein LOC118405053 [Branchiostoma floridae]